MWSLTGKRMAQGLAPMAVAASSFLYHGRGESRNTGSRIVDENRSQCEAHSEADPQARLKRKQTALQCASEQTQLPRGITRRFDTRKQLDEIRKSEKEMLLRWERDEEGWRELPARAWPAYQPNPEQLKSIQIQVEEKQCFKKSANSDICTELLFNMATALVFYNIDAQRGFEQYEALAKQGHVDSMVACGIILVEGLGIAPNEKKGIEWLQKAVARNSAQGCFEMGTVLYTGIDGILEEDSEAAFEYFRRAAEQDHTGGMYMMADCLLEGEGTEKNVGRAVPLFYKAAERGHRYSRQKIRELLAQYSISYPL